MGLMDKFKNLFTDEEVIEEEDEVVEIKEVKKEEKSKLPTFMREKIAKEEQEKKKEIVTDEEIGIEKEIKLEKIPNDELIIDEDIKEEKPTFKFPIDFTENDMTETRVSRQAMHSKQIEKPTITPRTIDKEMIKEKQIPQKKELKVSEIYKDKKEEKQKDIRCFRATPIISPIYGIVDKNYDPRDIETNKGHNLADTRPSKSVDFDSVRKKAYGSLTEEIKENLMCENCEYLKEAKECRKRNNAIDELYDDEMVNNSTEEYDNITIDEATENYYDYGVEYQKNSSNYYEPDKEESYYFDDEPEENEVKITNHVEETEERTKKNKEIPPVKSSINLLSTLKKSMGDEEEPPKEKNLDLTDDLFNLIDSMYDERNDDK